MAEHDNERRMDELLDSLLASYSGAEPRPGFESRLLANLRGQATPQHSPGWGRIWAWMGIITAAAALAAIFAVSYFGRQVPHTAPVASHFPEPVPQPVQKPSASQQVAAVKTHHRKPVQRGIPIVITAEVRQEVFPTPVPLSEQERLLLGYMARTPKQEVIAQGRTEKPVTEEAFAGATPEVQAIFQRTNSTR
jgi:hypothetical protein